MYVQGSAGEMAVQPVREQLEAVPFNQPLACEIHVLGALEQLRDS
jgi:hypothetical protein